MALLQAYPKEGFKRSTLVVRSKDVDLESIPYQNLKRNLRTWKMVDRYVNPGPTQFQFDKQEDVKMATTVQLMNQKTDDLAE